ncbi:hypothetical protein AB833_21555 [Chromatiales bacterium (ex Bugula neritina AB1)]|nr:hypothetical protein AB833_21555 [Chromatiales bacterium (ex Bugula neritina AB1)]
MAGPLPLNALNAFVVAARQGSFSKAAEELHVTPAAVSQQIRSLEESLGIQLFHRLNRGLALTDAGRSGLVKLQSGFADIQQAVELMRTGGAASELNIWTAPSFASKWLMPRMHRFIELNSSIDLRISGSSALIDSNSTAPSLSAETLKSHNIDVAIRFGSGNYPGCEVQRMMDVVAIPLCSPELLDKSASLPLSNPSDLRHHTLLHDESPYEGRPTWASWFEDAGLAGETAQHNLYFNSVSLALTAAIEGQGVVLTLEQMAQDDVDKGRLVPLFDRPMKVSHAYHLVTLANAEDDPRVKAFGDWIFSEIDRNSS